jgi:hypothetical protein
MAAYGRDIGEVMGWTFPQLRLLNKHHRARDREARRFQLWLASGTLAPEMLDQLWQGLGGEPLDLKSAPAARPAAATTESGHDVDSEGNVLADGPLLSDIALGKAHAPALIPITVIKKENDGTERHYATPAGD